MMLEADRRVVPAKLERTSVTFTARDIMLRCHHYCFIILCFFLVGQSVATKASVTSFQPRQCPGVKEEPKQKQPLDEQKPAKAFSPHPMTEEDCWFDIVNEIDQLRAQGRVLVVTDIDKTLLYKGKIMQTGIPGIIRWLKNTENVDVVALTARKPSASAKTQKQLHHFSIDMKDQFYPSLLNEEQITQFVISNLRDKKPTMFRNNIIYTRNQDHKSWALGEFCQLFPADTYAHIIFIDDLLDVCLLIARQFKAPEHCSVSIKHYTRGQAANPEACSKYPFHSIPDDGEKWLVSLRNFESTSRTTASFLAMTFVVFLILAASSMY